MDAAVIAATALSKSFPPDRHVFDGLTFDVPAGGLLALVGPTQSGKTTLVNILMGATAPSEGRATVAGHDVARDPRPVRAAAAFIGPTAALYPDLTARDNVAFFGLAAGVRASHRDVANSLRRAGVPERCFAQPVSTLPRSRGLQVAMAVALLRRPAALIIDEPATRADDDMWTNFADGLQELRTDGTAVLFTTADATFAARLTPHVLSIARARRDADA